jgi:lysophospholipase L1-like esterase
MMSGRRLKVVALGSSFAAGPGIEPILEQNARRSGRNYPQQLAKLLDADLTDLTVSGATLLNVLSETQETIGKTFEPQLDLLPKDADIVTLTGGGNDLGYSGGMIYDSCLALESSPQRDAVLDFMLPPGSGLSIENLTTRFLNVIDKVHETSPNANIYLVDYVAVFGESEKSGRDTPLSIERVRHYREQASILAKAYHTAASSREGVELIEMSQLSTGHELGTEEPWVIGFDIEMFFKGLAPYHPNLEAHTAAAEELHKRIIGSMEKRPDAQ